jgi:hypothetical protein
VIALVPQFARFPVVVLTPKQWTFNPSTQELTAQWVNPAGDSLAAEIGYDPSTSGHQTVVIRMYFLLPTR